MLPPFGEKSGKEEGKEEMMITLAVVDTMAEVVHLVASAVEAYQMVVEQVEVFKQKGK